MPSTINFPMASPPIVGADISAYQANRLVDPIQHFDFERFLAKGGRFILMRATVAADGFDYEFEYNLAQCKRLKIPFGIYHYEKLWKNLDRQADLVCQALDRVEDEPLWMGYHKPARYAGMFLDIEANDGLSKETFTGNYIKQVKKIIERSGVRPGLYTRATFWDNNTYRNDEPKKAANWVAHWPGNNIDPFKAPTFRPWVPNDIGAIANPIAPVFWQFDVTSEGREWGSMGDNDLDLDWFTADGGTPQAFLEWFGVSVAPVTPPPDPEPDPEPEPEPASEYDAIMKVNGMNVRYAPATNNLPFAKGIANQKVKVIGPVENGYVPVKAYLYAQSLKKI